MIIPDKISVTVLEDGSVKVETDGVSPANHMSAEAFMSFLTKKLGGTSKTVRKREGHAHSHAHGHDHAGH